MTIEHIANTPKTDRDLEKSHVFTLKTGDYIEKPWQSWHKKDYFEPGQWEII